IPNLQRRFETTESEWVKARLHHYMSEQPCETCKGTRLRKEALAVRMHTVDGLMPVMPHDVVDDSEAQRDTGLRPVRATNGEQEIPAAERSIKSKRNTHGPEARVTGKQSAKGSKNGESVAPNLPGFS